MRLDLARANMDGGAHQLARIAVMVFAVALPRDMVAQAPQRDSVVAPVAPTPPNPDSVYRPEEIRGYLLGTFGPRPIIRALALAGFDQWRHRPASFPSNGRGFGDRLGSRYGQVAISHTLRFGLSRVFDERTIPYRVCACGDSSSRVAYALLSPLRVNTPNGVRLSMMNPIAEITSGILVTTVRSGGLQVADGVRNGIIGLAGESAASLVREFWPWHWRPPFL
ncbi:MAG: hypothetical protein JWM41_4795 [Gemmatimonadetes bacterium]|nr:hypothetical protein [Gemmatimonadota bacterium]